MHPGKLLILLGIICIGVGLLWQLGVKLPFGRLPGDFTFRKDGVNFYFPLGTCLLISLVLSLLFWLFKR